MGNICSSIKQLNQIIKKELIRKIEEKDTH